MAGQKHDFWVVEIVETRTVRVRVKGPSQKNAIAQAEALVAVDPSDFKVASTRSHVVNHWPADEPEEVKHDLGNGYHVHRGWWVEVEYMKPDPHKPRVQHRRKVSFKPDLVDPGGFGLRTANFDNLIGRDATLVLVTESYGWAAAHGSSTWSKVHATPKAAYDDCRAFVTAEQVDFDQRRQDMRVLAWVGARGGKLERVRGGLWLIPGEDDIGDYVTNKGQIDHLIEGGYVRVTDILTISGAPREVEITDKGREEAASWAALPEIFR